ncbi:hypothetical protein MK904_00335 [Loigolactobacillus coryniformis]|uniref:hypothetical protein n=1 Tax=Loigolactobacillus coryniformis TaxID=1610 RepID=UPI0023418670|nr:hypothetical protein [Loigolactobacillus coryniformis]MDC4184543.1 hypothetical protein [Loigolactobacillus coryniformis]
MELIIKGKPEEIKNVLQAIGSSKEHNEIEATAQHALSTANFALSEAEANKLQIARLNDIKSKNIVTGALSSSKDA